MQSLQTQTIDDFSVVTGFQNRPINPIETEKQSAAAILGTTEAINLKNKQENQHRYITRSQEARKKAIYHLSLANGTQWIEGVNIDKNKAAATKQDKIASDLVGVINTCNEELKPLATACKEKTKEILRSNPVFFEARKDEVIKSESELIDLLQKFAGKTENQSLLEDGSFIDDFRGKVFHKKTSGIWSETSINALGVKKSANTTYTNELTESEKTEIAEQKESDRINGLSSEEKMAEYDEKVASLLSESTVMRSKLEIQGEAEALTQSQTFYNTELDKLKLKYGIV